MTWAQRAGWNRRLKEPTGPDAFALACTLPVDGLTAGRLLGILGQMVERHEALRSRFLVDAAGEPRQDVLAAGEFTVGFREFDPGEAPDPAAQAQSVAEELKNRAGDVENSFLTWACVITVDDAPAHLALAVSHFFADGVGVDILCREIASLVAGETLPELDPAAWRPVDQALYENSPKGRKLSRRALLYWEQNLAEGPASMFPERRADHPEPRFVQIEMISPALAVAVQGLAQALGSSATTVSLALLCSSLGRALGTADLMFELISKNRWQPEAEGAVCNIAQNSLFRVRLDAQRDPGFPDVVRATARSALLAQRHSRHDPAPLDGIVRSVGERRGLEVERSCFFNFTADLPSEDHPGPPGRPGGLLPATTVRTGSRFTSGGTKFFLGVGGTGTGLYLSLFVDLDYLPLDDAVALLRDMEHRAVVEHAAAVG
ncbi:condensation domain-containing protein [Streptomyces sp. NPDC020983]|uniref:condensation domain-containing protein n=1 Tax=Streptomyces sp. NPDC020983 TaxID=3365106 RepID=UPI0037A3DB1E